MPAGAGRRPSPALQPSGAASIPAQSGLMTAVSVAPPMLQVRAAQQPRPANGDDEESCSVCVNPKIGNFATCGLPGCNDHFDVST
eukprot:3254909-Pyramimonas_sp.AAC.1